MSQPPGSGGLIPPPVNAPAGQPTPVGVQPGATAFFVQLRAGNTIINSDGIFQYSGPPAAGNLILSSTPAGVTQDQFGNPVIGGAVASYGTSFAAALIGGALLFYTPFSGWFQQATIETDSGGDLVTACNGNLDLGANGGLFFNGTQMTVP